MSRRQFLVMVGAAGAALAGYRVAARAATGGGTIAITEVKPGEDVFAYISRVQGGFDQTLYQQVIGAANDFKEGDQTIGVGAADEATRDNARALLANTKIRDLHEHPLLVDDLQQLIWQTTDQAQYAKVQDWTMGQLKEFLLTASEPEIKGVMYGLTSDTIGCVPKLMSNQELTALGQKIFNELPGTRMGAKGIHGRADPAQFSHGPSRGRRLAGLRRLRLRDGRHRHRHQPRGQHGHERRCGRKGAQGHRRHLQAGGHHSLVRAFPHRRPGGGGRELSGNGRHDVPEPRRNRRLQQDVRCHGREDPEVRKIKAGRTIRALLRDRPGFRVHQWRGERRGHDGARVPEVRFQPGRRSGAREGATRGRLAPCQRCGRIHRPGGLQEPRPAGAVLPGRYRHGQTPWADHRPGYLLHPAHDGQPGGSGLVPGPDHAGQSRLPDRVAHQERSDAGLSDDIIPGSRPAEGKVRLQGQRCDVGFLQADRDRGPERQIHRELRRSSLGVLPVPPGQG